MPRVVPEDPTLGFPAFPFHFPRLKGKIFNVLGLSLSLFSNEYSNVYLKYSKEGIGVNTIHNNRKSFTFEVTVRRDSGREKNLALPWHPTIVRTLLSVWVR